MVFYSAIFGLHHILFLLPWLYPLNRSPIQGVNIGPWSKPKWPPILGLGSSIKYAGVFDLRKNLFAKLRNKWTRKPQNEETIIPRPYSKPGYFLFESLYKQSKDQTPFYYLIVSILYCSLSLYQSGEHLLKWNMGILATKCGFKDRHNTWALLGVSRV